MVYLANHATVAGSILNFNNLRDLAKSESHESSLLVLGSTDFALNLLYFYCCHCIDSPLSVKHLIHADTTYACDSVSVTQL